MLRLAVTFLILAAVTGLFAFDLLGDVGWEAGRGWFVVFFALAAGSLVANEFRRGPAA